MDLVKEAKAITATGTARAKTHYVNCKDAVTSLPAMPRNTALSHRVPASTLVPQAGDVRSAPGSNGMSSSRMSKGNLFRKAIVTTAIRYAYDKVELHGDNQKTGERSLSKHGFPKVTLHHLSKTNPQGCPKGKVSGKQRKTPKQSLQRLVYSRRPIRLHL